MVQVLNIYKEGGPPEGLGRPSGEKTKVGLDGTLRKKPDEPGSKATHFIFPSQVRLGGSLLLASTESSTTCVGSVCICGRRAV